MSLILNRFRARWTLNLLSLVGIALTVGLIASIPIFADSVGFGILNAELNRYATHRAGPQGSVAPPLAVRYYRIASAPEPMTVQQALDTGVWLCMMTEREVGLSVARTHTQIGSHALTLRALEGDSHYTQRDLRQVRINAIPDVADHIRILQGQPLETAHAAGQLLIWARPEFLEDLGLQVGEEYELYNFNAVHPEVPFRFRVAGTWEALDPQGEFWYRDPHDLLAQEFLTSMPAYERYIASYMPTQVDFCFWYFVLDEEHLRFRDVDQYLRGVTLAQARAESMLPSIRVDRSPGEPLQLVQSRTRVLQILLSGLSLPIIGLMLSFVGTISAISAKRERLETAILMSRGASRGQVLLLGLAEAVFQIIVGVPAGIGAAIGLARLMSRNASFLGFDRSPLGVAVQSLDWHTVALAMGILLVARVMPTLQAANQTIISHSRARARPLFRYTVPRLLLNAGLVATTYYAYHQLSSRGTLGVIAIESNGGATRDPLVFLAPALFILTTAFVMAQLFPVLMHVPNMIGGLLPGVSVYTSLRNLARDAGAYTAPLFLLILCLCLGSFEASIARSADVWLQDRLRHKVGADYTFAQGVVLDGPGAGRGDQSWLLPASEYVKLPEVEAATRVGVYAAIPSIAAPGGRKSSQMGLLGIDRLDFARVAYWRDDYADEPLGALLNRLGAQNDGLLVTERFLERTGLALGERVVLDVISADVLQAQDAVVRIPFTLAGSLSHFPTLYEDQQTLAVANLEYIYEALGGVEPHSVWLRTQPDVDIEALQAGLTGLGLVPENEQDSRAAIRQDSERLERVGIFGSLTVGFMSGSVVAWLGLLIHTFASLTGRIRGFTVMRAIGLRLHQVLTIVSIEYLCVMLYGVLCGWGSGLAASYLFVRYLQFTEDPSTQVPPFRPLIAHSQIEWILLAYLLVLLFSEAIVLLLVTRRGVFQALRVGDEE